MFFNYINPPLNAAQANRWAAKNVWCVSWHNVLIKIICPLKYLTKSQCSSIIRIWLKSLEELQQFEETRDASEKSAKNKDRVARIRSKVYLWYIMSISYSLVGRTIFFFDMVKDDWLDLTVQKSRKKMKTILMC